jgi:hypothetical protein
MTQNPNQFKTRIKYISLYKEKIMKAVEFKSRINRNRILIPAKIQSQLRNSEDKDVRVIVFIDDSEINDESLFPQVVNEQFLSGYADSDSIYDTHE